MSITRTTFLNWISRRISQSRPVARRRIGIGRRGERLETRTMLAGNVLVRMDGHELHITGDDASNQVEITRINMDLIVRGLTGTTINGQTADFLARAGVAAIKGALHVNMNGGDDTFVITDSTNMRRRAYIDMGDGNDTFGLHNSARVRKYLEVNTGAGNDAISLSNVIIEGDAAFFTGSGDDVISVANSGIGDFLHVFAGDGADALVVDTSSVHDNLVFEGGAGNDDVVLRTAAFEDGVVVNTSSGDDFLHVQGISIGDPSPFFLGSGNDNMVFAGTNLFGRSISVFGQGGTDAVEVSAQSIFRRGFRAIDTDASTVSDTLETDRLNNATTGALTRATQARTAIDTLITPPPLTVTITQTTVAENAGATALTGTVSRPAGANTNALVVNLASNDTTELTVPATVTIPAGATSVNFTIAAVDDTFIDGTKNVTITASSGGFTNGTDTVAVTDNETGPAALTVSVNVNSVAEGAGASAATGTVTRNSEPTAALTVTLTSSDTTEATVPQSVVIPAGQTSVTFAIAAVDDSADDGTQTVTITAAAAQHSNGTDTLQVTDNEIPLTLDLTGNTTVQSNGTLITEQASLNVGGTTTAGATVALDVDGDGFDDGTTTAAQNGSFTLTAPLTNNTTNRGANALRFRATPASGTGQTIEELDVHRAVGSVVRFTPSNSTFGTFDVELLDAAAPNTVANFKDYFARYTNSIIHRSPVDFVIQGGGFTANNGVVDDIATDAPIQNEFNAANSNVRGTLSLALLGGQPNSGTSGWFINVVNNTFLDQAQHTVFGRVIGDGMDVVDAMNNVPIFNLNSQLGDVASAFGELPLLGNVPFENLQGTVSVAAGSTTVTGNGTSFLTQLVARNNNIQGSTIRIGSETFTVASIQSNTQLTLSAVHNAGATNVVAQRHADPNQANYIVFSNIDEILD